MTDVFTLLSLPTSEAFSKYKPLEDRELGKARSDSPGPPRKTPRLDADSDSASASRSRAQGGSGSSSRIVIPIVGSELRVPAESAFDKDYALVRRSIKVILTKGTTERLPATYAEIYTACRGIVCVQKKGEGMYEALKLEVERCVGELARFLVYEGSENIAWVIPFIEVCVWFEKQVALLESLLAYLDRVYIHEHQELKSIHNLCYDQFNSAVLRDVTVIEKLNQCIHDWSVWERMNNAEHKVRPYIPQLVSRLTHHNQYEPMFERPFLAFTQKFYATEAIERSKELKPEVFVKHCLMRQQEEAERVRAVMPETSWSIVEDTVLRALLTDRLDWLAQGALPLAMENRETEELGKMYRLFASVDGRQVFIITFQDYVQAKVTSIVTDTAHDEEMVDRLLDIKAYIDSLIADAFADEEPVPLLPPSQSKRAGTSSEPMEIDAPPPKKTPSKDFVYAVGDAFRAGFKRRKNKPAEMIAKNLDRAMRKGQKGKKDEDFMKELDAVLALYRFTDDKDVFRTFYHRALAKRLLLEKSASDDFEKAMLKKLKEEYDPEFSMGDHMFNDLALSRDMMNEYQKFRQRNKDAAAQKVNVMVLQSSFWPFSAKKSDVILPGDMQSELSKYANFYKSKHSGRKLDWEHSLGTATLRGRFNNGEKELSVSLYQTLVLLLFNEEVSISFADIKEQTRIEDGELRRTLQSLACGKKRVLRKQPLGKDVHDDDVFHFNADFTDPAYRVHINTIQVKETPEESKKTQSLIEADRKHIVDAAIVRIMKANKEMHVEKLKTATIDAVKKHFIPPVPMIKERIEYLISSDYMKRKEDDMNTFTYIA
ncbi:Cullin-domain-containing protein [Panus rudis PR-1116 ss-1]|nr:Cullin-domain-containing protein [Panus rudis PR-1116 ss-1]